MTQEVMDALQPHSGGIYIDATLGGGTHTIELLERSGPDGRVLSLDVDPAALARARERLVNYDGRWTGVESNFRDIAQAAQANGFVDADGVLLDLGLSSDELLDPGKGLSFQVAGPLDMRLGPKSNAGLTAAEMINGWDKYELEQIFRDYGEERFASRIAEAIVRQRKARRILTTLDLSEVVRSAVPANYERGRIHPATRTFQALRIAVNDELGALKQALEGAQQIIKPGGVIAVISFHSLEDRIVKQHFKNNSELEPLTKRPLTASEQEMNRNPRSRSAKFRAARKFSSDNSETKTKTKTNYVSRLRRNHDTSA